MFNIRLMIVLQVTFAVFLGEPTIVGGYGFAQFAIAGCYATPIVRQFFTMFYLLSLITASGLCDHW